MKNILSRLQNSLLLAAGFLTVLTAATIAPSLALAATADIMWEKSLASGYAVEVKVDSTGAYIGGSDGSNGRIEKRDLTTGNLISTFGPGGADGDGVITNSYYIYYSCLAIDSTGIYTAIGTGNMRIEKRDLVSGNLISTFGAGGADGDGVVTTGFWDCGGGLGGGIVVDSTSMYIAGSQLTGPGNLDWRIEKRNKSTGALVNGFDFDGILTLPYSSNDDQAYDITLDATGAYIVGLASSGGNRLRKINLTTGGFIWEKIIVPLPTGVVVDSTGVYIAGRLGSLMDPDTQWQIEKRDLSTGNTIAAFDGDGIVTSNRSIGGYDIARDIAVDSTSIYVVGYANGKWDIENRSASDGSLKWEKSELLLNKMNDPNNVVVDSTGIYIAGYVESWVGPRQWRIEKRELGSGAYVDCGLRMQIAGAPVTISCEDPPVSTLRIYKGTKTYGVSVVDPADANASPLRVQIPVSGIKALRKQ